MRLVETLRADPHRGKFRLPGDLRAVTLRLGGVPTLAFPDQQVALPPG